MEAKGPIAKITQLTCVNANAASNKFKTSRFGGVRSTCVFRLVQSQSESHQGHTSLGEAPPQQVIEACLRGKHHLMTSLMAAI